MADDFLTPERALNDYIEEQKELAAEAAAKAAKEAAQKAAKEAAQKAAKEADKAARIEERENIAKRLHATGMKSSVIASVLDCPVSTVRKWIGAT